MNAPTYDLERFIRAQTLDYAQALAELTAGRKRTHWIWYVLPQLRDLGRSNMARNYGISDRHEAMAYLDNSVLGPRLIECVQAILKHRGKSAESILGAVDAMKFRSCLTLFNAVAPSKPVFSSALAAFYQGSPDEVTMQLLGSKNSDA